MAATWACEKFNNYLLGKQFHLETDHNPLVPLLGSKSLDELPVRVQRFQMRLMRFTYTIVHVPGKDLITADALSQAPTSRSTQEDDTLRQEVNAFVDLVMQNLPATQKCLEEIKKAQNEDEVCQVIKQYCKEGWPDRSLVRGALKPYIPVASEWTVQNDLLLRGTRIVIPTKLRLDMLDKLHHGHQGITKCRERARCSVWWPGLSRQPDDLVQNCHQCCKDRFQHAEPLIPSTFPELPWQKVATDMFDWKGHTYLLIVDYFSWYIEVAKLSGETSSKVIRHMKSIFAPHIRHIPLKVIFELVSGKAV